MRDGGKHIFQCLDHALGGPFVDGKFLCDLLHADTSVSAGGHVGELQQVLCFLKRHKRKTPTVFDVVAPV